MRKANSRLAIVERYLDQIGDLQPKEVVVVGNDDFSYKVGSIFEKRAHKVLFFGRRESEASLDSGKIECFSLDIASLRRQTGLIKHCQLVIVLSCDKAILEELLYAATPFCHIIIIGPIEGFLEDLDLYGTVHYKNLELTFSPII
jgi:hypothetical protein